MTVRNLAQKSVPDGHPLERGEIRSEPVPSLFHQLFGTRATGVLTVTQRQFSKRVDFEAGCVLFAASNDRDDRLNQWLLSTDAISLKNLMRCLETSLVSRDRLGEVLIRAGLMTPDAGEEWVKLQVRQIIYSIFNWTYGQFSFESKSVEPNSYSLRVTGDAMVLEGVRSITSWARVYEEVGGLNTEYLATRDAPTIVQGLPLLPEERGLLTMCKTPTSLAEMCEASRLKDYDVCKSIWGLLLVGALMKS